MKLREAWCRETSAKPEVWTEDNPAWGQCAVTALVIQDLLGGELMRAEINGISHYWNKVGGTTLDVTREQFPSVETFTDPEPRSREYVLSNPETVRRYQLLRERLCAI